MLDASIGDPSKRTRMSSSGLGMDQTVTPARGDLSKGLSSRLHSPYLNKTVQDSTGNGSDPSSTATDVATRSQPAAAAQSDPAPRPETVSTVNLKIPPFYIQDPALWFLQVESQFITQRVTSERSRFHHVVGALQPEMAMQIRDLLLNPPSDHPYTHLKEALVQRTSASAQHRINQLLSAEELGDQKPSNLLRRLQQLAGDTPVDSQFLKELFMKRLPDQCRVVLAASRESDIQQLSLLADRVMEVMPPHVRAVTVPEPVAEPLAELRAEVAALRREMQDLSTRGRSASRSPTRNYGRSRSSSQSRKSSGLCWYHDKFGDNARRCVPPCARAATFVQPSNSQAGR